MELRYWNFGITLLELWNYVNGTLELRYWNFGIMLLELLYWNYVIGITLLELRYWNFGITLLELWNYVHKLSAYKHQKVSTCGKG